MNTKASVGSGLMAGLIASFIWLMISTAVGMDKNSVLIGGVVFLIGTWLVTSVIATIIDRSHSKS